MARSSISPFDQYQKAVVGFREGHAVAMAGPGSGKTTVVVARIQALINEGTMPTSILSTTFTNEGAEEMRKRSGFDKDPKIFWTFHSWALRFINREGLSLPFPVHRDFHGNPAPLCLPLEQAKIIGGFSRGSGMKWKDAANYISLMKRRGLTPTQAFDDAETEDQERAAKIYQRYELHMREKGLLDFDSIVIETAKLLEARSEIRDRYQYKYVQVDEAQDTDAMQWRIIKCISETWGNVLAVGDENQGMYSWRGSESNLTEYFCALYPDAKVFPLPVNYRSTKNIVNYVKEIAPIRNETVEVMQTPNAHGDPPQFRLFTLEGQEADFIIGSVNDQSNTAVLVRTNRQLAELERACNDKSLRYTLLGKSGFWTRREVKDVIAIVSSVVAPTDASILGMLTARCDLMKYLRKTDVADRPGTITLLKDEQERTGLPLSKLLCTFHSGESFQDNQLHTIGGTCKELYASTPMLPAEMALRMVIDRFGVLSAYDVAEEDDKNFDNEPQENILKLVDFARRHSNLRAFYDFVQKVQRARRVRTNCLTLSTIHQAKGKEWNTVFVAGVNDGLLPHYKGDPSEEKRIYLVACSRAALRLHVSANGIPSELIKDRVVNEEAESTFWLEERG